MERVLKVNSHETVRARGAAQGRFVQNSAHGDIASRFNNSPIMIAQRKKLQSLFGGAAQLQGAEDEMLQGKFASEPSAQHKEESAPKANNTGLPDNLKSGIESLSSMSMDNVKVHYNSPPYLLTGHPPTKSVQLKTEEKLVATKNYGTGYYQYDHDSKGNIDDFSNNIATTTPLGPDPVDGSSWVDLENVPASGEGTMLSGKELEIVGAPRPQHFSMADRLNDSSAADRKSSYTWHHLTPEYQMVLVDMAVHAKFGHAGGVSFWT